MSKQIAYDIVAMKGGEKQQKYIDQRIFWWNEPQYEPVRA